MLPLFAQAAAGAPGGPPPPWVGFAVLAGVCGCYGLLAVGYFTLMYFFSRTVYRVLRRCHPDVRRLDPGTAWLHLIPCVNYVWFVVSALLVAKTLRDEYEDRGLDDEGRDFGKLIGLVSGGLYLAGLVVPYVPYLFVAVGQGGMQNVNNVQVAQLTSGGLSLLIWVPAFVLFVVYWVRLAGFGRELADHDDGLGAEADDRDRFPEGSPDDRAD